MNKAIILFCLTSILLVSCYSNKNTEVEVIKLLETSESWNGDHLPDYLDGTPKITVLKVTIPPKTVLAVHKHPVINAGVLLKGEFMVVTEKRDTLRLKAGDAISEVVNTWHHGINNGTESAEIIVFYAGVEGSPITVLKEKN